MAGDIFYVSNSRALKEIDKPTLRIDKNYVLKKEQIGRIITIVEKKPERPSEDPLVAAYNDCKQKLLEQDILGNWKAISKTPFEAKYDGQFRITFGLGISTSNGGGGSGETSGNIKITDSKGNVFFDIPLRVKMQGQYWRESSRPSAEYSSYGYSESIVLPIMKGMVISYSGAGLSNPQIRYYERRYYGRR